MFGLIKFAPRAKAYPTTLGRQLLLAKARRNTLLNQLTIITFVLCTKAIEFPLTSTTRDCALGLCLASQSCSKTASHALYTMCGAGSVCQADRFPTSIEILLYDCDHNLLQIRSLGGNLRERHCLL